MYPGERTGGYAYDATSVLAGTPTWTGAGQFGYVTPSELQVVQGQYDFHYKFDQRVPRTATLTLHAGDSIWLMDGGVQLLNQVPDSPGTVARTLWVAVYEGDGELQVADGVFNYSTVPTFTDRSSAGVVGTSHFYDTRSGLDAAALTTGDLAFRLTCVSGTVVLTFAGLQVEGQAGYFLLDGWTWSAPSTAGTDITDVRSVSAGLTLTVDANTGALEIAPSGDQVGTGMTNWSTQAGLEGDDGQGNNPDASLYLTRAAAIEGVRARVNAGTQPPYWGQRWGYFGYLMESGVSVQNVGTSTDKWWGTFGANIEVAVAPQRVQSNEPVTYLLYQQGLYGGSDYLDWEWVDTDFSILDWQLDRTLLTHTEFADLGGGATGTGSSGNVEVRLLGTSLPTNYGGGGSGALKATVYADAVAFQFHKVDVSFGIDSPMIVFSTVDARYQTATNDGASCAWVYNDWATRGVNQFDRNLGGLMGLFRRPPYRFKIPTFIPGPSPQVADGPSGLLLSPNPLLGGGFDQVDVNFG